MTTDTSAEPDHYAALGLDRNCTAAQIRAAYRLLAKRHHPDVNPGSRDAMARMHALNTAHETLTDPARRRAYDRELDDVSARRAKPFQKIERNVSQDVHLRIEELFRGTSLRVDVRDPGNSGAPETYEVEIPPGTAPGTRIRLARAAPFDGGFVTLRVRLAPNARFKARGSDLRCDLRISAQRATYGGREMISGPDGARVTVDIPRHAKRGEVIRIRDEGLPKPRGGRGDLLVRIVYRPEVRVSRATNR